MANLDKIFQQIEDLLIISDGSTNLSTLLKEILKETNSDKNSNMQFNCLLTYIHKIIKEIDELANIINNTDSVLISVKNQKILRTCYQVICYFGISNCLIPGLGLTLSRNSSSVQFVSQIELNDDQKYIILCDCTDFFQRSYKIPVLKNIVITFHLSDYLAALIQLSFAPLKKPGVFKNYTMTEEKYTILSKERCKYVEIYEDLVTNCFQPMLMKELLVLQNVSKIETPTFVNRVVAREMSRRLIASGGLISLIRCFLECYNIDTGVEWKKIDMICKIICTKHGNSTEMEYISNICNQLNQIFTLNNIKYLSTAVSCLFSLSNKYPNAEPISELQKAVCYPFAYKTIITKHSCPGTVLLTSQEVEHKVIMLYACMLTKLDLPYKQLSSNLKVLFGLTIKCSNNDTKAKLNYIIFKIMESLDKDTVYNITKDFLLEDTKADLLYVSVYEKEANLMLKCTNNETVSGEQKITLLKDIFKNTTSTHLNESLLEGFFQIFVDLNIARQKKSDHALLTLEDDPKLISSNDERYGHILLLLTEVLSMPKADKTLKQNHMVIIDFIEKLLKFDNRDSKDCITVALVLLNTVLVNSNRKESIQARLAHLIPLINKLSRTNGENNILCKEILSQIETNEVQQTATAYSTALSNVFDGLLPVQANGLMELTKLIEVGDPETLSKRHYVFCLFQEQLKHSDSYVYLSAINGIAALAAHCTEDVLQILCKEFIEVSTKNSAAKENNVAELRMKIGDVVVKVTRRLGDLAVIHKSLLLNTFLCGCRDHDPLIRTSALSNLAEIVLVLHYRVGTIIYEILHHIESIIETDKAIECRRAAVMVLSSLIKGLGRETLIELKDSILPVYKTLIKLYKNDNEDSIVRLHAQVALEEINDIVKEFLSVAIPTDIEIGKLDQSIREIKFK
ncbi:unnamed protein product [Leptosia nina]|uniref:Transport and golgi organization 6 n=1 Tax=Leptosia nina TaxID=320188 RepID=A0AAV1JPB5_9NEOP